MEINSPEITCIIKTNPNREPKFQKKEINLGEDSLPKEEFTLKKIILEFLKEDIN
jgi:hypothetical protein